MPCIRPATATERAATLGRAVAIALLLSAGAATMALQHHRSAPSVAAAALAPRVASRVAQRSPEPAVRAAPPAPAEPRQDSTALSRDEIAIDIDIHAMPLAEAVRQLLGADTNYVARCRAHTCKVRVLAVLAATRNEPAPNKGSASVAPHAVVPAAAPQPDPPGLFPSDG